MAMMTTGVIDKYDTFKFILGIAFFSIPINMPVTTMNVVLGIQTNQHNPLAFLIYRYLTLYQFFCATLYACSILVCSKIIFTQVLLQQIWLFKLLQKNWRNIAGSFKSMRMFVNSYVIVFDLVNGSENTLQYVWYLYSCLLHSNSDVVIEFFIDLLCILLGCGDI